MRIAEDTYSHIVSEARSADGDEMMGFLASPPDESTITAFVRLDAETGASFAVASPSDLLRTVESFRAKGLVPRGLAHSHGHSPVYHSSIDDSTAARLLPMMARWCLSRPRPRFAAPMVISQDEAVVPCPDGQTILVQLLGPEIAGTDVRDRAAWKGTTHVFDSSAVEARVTIGVGKVEIQGAGIRLELGVPEDSTVIVQRVDASSHRSALLFSLVVNVLGRAFVQATQYLEMDGQTFTHRFVCPVELISSTGDLVEIIESDDDFPELRSTGTGN
jgi:proteasome lid subunit RPN8/RPN11